MPAEVIQERGRIFLKNVCYFFDDKFGFNVIADAYEGEGTTSIFLNEEVEEIRFDFFMFQRRLRVLANGTADSYRVRFIGECKWRSRSGSLKREFREFLKRAIKVSELINRRHNGLYYFLFVTNRKFQIDLDKMNNVAYLRNYINEEVNEDHLRLLLGKIGILFLPDWFLETVKEGH